MGQFEKSLELYDQALLEYNDDSIKFARKNAEKVKKEIEAKQYIDPEKAEVHREQGNKFF
jgi:stress-induced-phosphoprotein 1